ncbi:transposase [Streptomyces sp. NPDC058572]|uniref:transposase n=1 Tax=Streptomyces sp. NPDC058572 TaxID=3346546 RepID=UPI00365DB408
MSTHSASRGNLTWKYCLGLELEDVGFDASVLSEFRTRVVAHGLEERVLDLLLVALKGKGLVKAGWQPTHTAPRAVHRLPPAQSRMESAQWKRVHRIRPHQGRDRK